jgi:hypothetical protein
LDSFPSAYGVTVCTNHIAFCNFSQEGDSVSGQQSSQLPSVGSPSISIDQAISHVADW